MLASGTLAVMLSSGTLAVMLASGTLAVMLASGTFDPSVTLASSVPFFITFVTNSLASSSVNFPVFTSSLINIAFVTNSLASSSVNFPVFTSSLIKLLTSSSAVDIPLEADVSLVPVDAIVPVVVLVGVVMGTLLFVEY